ncbi:MAG TPA: hypothetical protein VFI52_10790 [Gemmatimonadaceae bacterium]|nr:hypothetical protein [Gemmatimonadaceae bacterium]
MTLHEPDPILRVLRGDEMVCAITSTELPVEVRPMMPLVPGGPLRFVDSAGRVRSFDLSSALDDGDRFLHLSVRVSETFVVQVDGVLTARVDDDPQLALQAGARAVRMQPFFLPERAEPTPDLPGRGLFRRGLHFAGQVTPSNVSLLCLCDRCERSFRVQSFHAGFRDVTYLYCSTQPHVLIVDRSVPDAPPLLSDADPEAVARFERRLPPCADCGGSFAYLNPFRCPHCLAPYIDFAGHPEERAGEYYGNYLYGGAPQRLST